MGVFKIDLLQSFSEASYTEAKELTRWAREMPSNHTQGGKSFQLSATTLPTPIEPLYLNADLAKCRYTTGPATLDQLLSSSEVFSDMVDDLLACLRKSVETRVRHQPDLCKNCVPKNLEGRSSDPCLHAKIGVLFSGGLDSAVIAALARWVMLGF